MRSSFRASPWGADREGPSLNAFFFWGGGQLSVCTDDFFRLCLSSHYDFFVYSIFYYSFLADVD